MFDWGYFSIMKAEAPMKVEREPQLYDLTVPQRQLPILYVLRVAKGVPLTELLSFKHLINQFGERVTKKFLLFAHHKVFLDHVTTELGKN